MSFRWVHTPMARQSDGCSLILNPAHSIGSAKRWTRMAKPGIWKANSARGECHKPTSTSHLRCRVLSACGLSLWCYFFGFGAFWTLRGSNRQTPLANSHWMNDELVFHLSPALGELKLLL